MKLQTLINRIAAECPAFGGRVLGAGALPEAPGTVALPGLPCALVLRTLDDMKPSVTAGGVTQPAEIWFNVAVCVDNSADALGHAADDQLEDIKTSLIAALVGWTPDGANQSPMEYRGFKHIGQDAARFWRRFEFALQLGG